MKNKSIIIWQCPLCKDVVLSNDWESHKMDYCKCQENACDMEVDYVRWVGCSVLERRAKIYDLEELLKSEVKKVGNKRRTTSKTR